jgi:hypothetical protein
MLSLELKRLANCIVGKGTPLDSGVQQVLRALYNGALNPFLKNDDNDQNNAVYPLNHLHVLYNDLTYLPLQKPLHG